jgi:hypothetical protein
MNLTDLLQGQLSEDMLSQLSQQLGGAEKEKTAAAATGIMNVLVGGLAKNASKPEGAQSLNNALERDNHDSLLENIMGMLGGNQAAVSNQRAANGAGIINHILGDRQSGAVDMISKMSGLDQGQTGNLMTMLAPMLMGALGQQKKQNNLGADGIAGLLTQVVSQQKQSSGNPTMDLAMRFLDSDGDGSVMDDVANIGMKFLGNFFKKR